MTAANANKASSPVRRGIESFSICTSASVYDTECPTILPTIRMEKAGIAAGLVRSCLQPADVGRTRTTSSVLVEVVERPLPGELGRLGVEARRRVVVEAVLRPRIDERLVRNTVRLQRRLVRRPAGVDPLIVCA